MPQGRSRGSLAAPGRDHGGAWEKCEEEGMTQWNSYGLTPTPPFPILCITQGGGGGKGAENEGVI